MLVHPENSNELLDPLRRCWDLGKAPQVAMGAVSRLGQYEGPLKEMNRDCYERDHRLDG